MRRTWTYLAIIVATAVLTAAVLALLGNIRQRKEEGRSRFLPLAELADSVVDPALWGKNYPREYDGYLRTVDTLRTRYGGSEAFSKLETDPALKRIYAGYAFGVDFREERGHAYSLIDQQLTLRTQQFKQPGACLHCHAGGMKSVYEKAGGGDLVAGFAKVCAMPLADAWKLVKHPIACVDCHDPKTMRLRVTRPGFLNGIRVLKAVQGVRDYDPNTMATRQEMRSYVCGQCHVEYYFLGENKILTFPWEKGLNVDNINAYYDEYGFKDWEHKDTGAPMVKIQHPEFELYSTSIHNQSGVACADCHMPYIREGALKVSDHWIRSPIQNVANACQTCHKVEEAKLLERISTIQGRTAEQLREVETAIIAAIDAIVAAKAAGATDVDLVEARDFQRKANLRWDFISSENSTGFHSPQEAARVLGDAVNFARMSQLSAERLLARLSEEPATDPLLQLNEPEVGDTQ
jgi:nitrite reductase (cytochrome c-552)